MTTHTRTLTGGHMEEIARLQARRREWCPDCRHRVELHLISEPGVRGGCVLCHCGEQFIGISA